jgi:hypothetical protein
LFYPRRGQYSPPSSPGSWTSETFPEQYKLRATLTLNDYAQITNQDDIWITSVLYQSESYELTLPGMNIGAQNNNIFRFSDIASSVETALLNPLDYEIGFRDDAIQARLYSWKRNYFWDKTQSQVLGPSQLPTQMSTPLLPAFAETAVAPTLYIADELENNVTDQMMQSELVQKEAAKILVLICSYFPLYGIHSRSMAAESLNSGLSLSILPSRFFETANADKVILVHLHSFYCNS